MIGGRFLLGLSVASGSVAALNADGWTKQSIYQVLTDRFARSDLSETAPCNSEDAKYCGGTWRGLAKKLDYIQGMGFTAVWISPVVTQLEGTTKYGEAYHGYWAQDIWSLNSHFGTEDDFKALSDELHGRGMYLMVDVVTNHMAYNGCGECVDYSQFNPFDAPSYYHDFCLVDYSDQYSSQLQTCWEGDNAVSLPDMRTEDDGVRAIWRDWVARFVSRYGIDGLRIDSVKHVEKSFHGLFEDAAGVFTMGEVLHGDPTYVLDYQEHMGGLLNYPAFFWMRDAFLGSSRSMTALADGIKYIKANAANTSRLGSFSENHDQERWPQATSDMALVKNVVTLTMMGDGIPVIYQGQEHCYKGGAVEGRAAIWFSGYNKEAEMYQWIAKLNAARQLAMASDPSFVTYQAWPIYSDESTMALRKGFDGGQIVSVYSNRGSDVAEYSVTLDSSSTGFRLGEEVIDILTCDIETVKGGGYVNIRISYGKPRVLMPLSITVGSRIC